MSLDDKTSVSSKFTLSFFFTTKTSSSIKSHLSIFFGFFSYARLFVLELNSARFLKILKESSLFSLLGLELKVLRALFFLVGLLSLNLIEFSLSIVGSLLLFSKSLSFTFLLLSKTSLLSLVSLFLFEFLLLNSENFVFELLLTVSCLLLELNSSSIGLLDFFSTYNNHAF